MDLCLIIETSLSGVGISLADLGSANPLLWSKNHPFPGNSAAMLQDFIEQAFKEKGIERSRLSRVCISHGPGSFTGIKIGLAWTYGLKAALNDLLLTGISGIECALKQICVRENHQKITLFLPSTKTHGYLCSGDINQVKCELVDIRQDDLFNNVVKENLPVYVIGNSTILEDRLNESAYEFEIVENKMVIELALAGMLSDVLSPSRVSWEKNSLPSPRYLREPTVVEKFQLSQKNK